MSDLIKRGQALKCAEHDTETYYALSCLPGVDAIPVEWLKNFSGSLDTLSESMLKRAIELIIEAYKDERKEE